MKLILGSGSPRRKMLLEALGHDVEVVRPFVDETRLKGESATDAAVRLARLKLDDVRPRSDGETPCVCADTLVFMEERVFGKPNDGAEATAMLTKLRGRSHFVVTGVSVGYRFKVRSLFVKTEVVFRSFSDAEMQAYIATGEPFDKAGGYGIQSGGGALTSSIVGSYSNVVGLPVEETLCLVDEIYAKSV